MLIHKTTNLQNHFLIAMPNLQDPLFKRSVVYICEHNSTGAMGIIINKPLLQYTIDNILNNLKITSSNRDPSIQLNDPILAGGPLLNDRGFIVHSSRKGFNSSVNVSQTTMITTSQDILETLGTPDQPKDILIALGYSGWAQEQLEYELIQNNWIIAPANKKILFHTPIVFRWNNALKTLGIDICNISYNTGKA